MEPIQAADDGVDPSRGGDRKLSDCSTTSAVAPSKTPKKVSFSDELPGGSTVEDLEFQSAMEFMLQKNHNYLNDLHQSACDGTTTTDECDDVGQSASATMAFPNHRKESLHQQDASVDPIMSILKSATKVDEIVHDSELKEVVKTSDAEDVVAGNRRRNGGGDVYHHKAVDDIHYCSAMELEVRRDKRRWMLISECSVLLGDARHTRDGFRKVFLDQVS